MNIWDYYFNEDEFKLVCASYVFYWQQVNALEDYFCDCFHSYGKAVPDNLIAERDRLKKRISDERAKLEKILAHDKNL
jgi:hypothetical protein